MQKFFLDGSVKWKKERSSFIQDEDDTCVTSSYSLQVGQKRTSYFIEVHIQTRKYNVSIYGSYTSDSLVSRLLPVFNIAWEKWRGLVKLIVWVT